MDGSPGSPALHRGGFITCRRGKSWLSSKYFRKPLWQRFGLLVKAPQGWKSGLPNQPSWGGHTPWFSVVFGWSCYLKGFCLAGLLPLLGFWVCTHGHLQVARLFSSVSGIYYIRQNKIKPGSSYHVAPWILRSLVCVSSSLQLAESSCVCFMNTVQGFQLYLAAGPGKGTSIPPSLM